MRRGGRGRKGGLTFCSTLCEVARAPLDEDDEEPDAVVVGYGRGETRAETPGDGGRKACEELARREGTTWKRSRWTNQVNDWIRSAV